MKNSLHFSIVLASACLGGSGGCAKPAADDLPSDAAPTSDAAKTTESPEAAETAAAPAAPRQLVAARTPARAEARLDIRGAAMNSTATVRKVSDVVDKPEGSGASHARPQTPASGLATSAPRPVAARTARPANLGATSHAGETGDAGTVNHATAGSADAGPRAYPNRTSAQVSGLSASAPTTAALTMHGEGEAGEETEITDKEE